MAEHPTPVPTRWERRIIALCCAAIVEREADAHAFAALKSGDRSFAELQELVLHYAVCCGWQAGALLDDLVVSAADRSGVAVGDRS